jgi:modulator of drug activity B
MQGRRFLVSSTWNALESSFDNEGSPVFRGRSLADPLSDITAPYRFCGYEILPEYGIFDVYRNPTVEADLEGYAKHLETVLASPAE